MTDERPFLPFEEDLEEDAPERVSLTAQTEERLDVIVSDGFDVSRTSASRAIADGRVTVNGAVNLRKSYKTLVGDEVTLTLLPPEPSEALPQDIPLDVVYEDDDLLVVNKPKGMVVHPAPGNPDGTLVNALLYHCAGKLSGVGGVIRPGIVHRIDKDTSGLLVVAKNDAAHLGLSEQIKEHSFTRVYYALLYGTPKEDSGTVNAPIGRDPSNRKKMAVTDRGSKEAVTYYRVLESFRGYSYCEMKLETGRTHQIRVHMSHVGHPVVGDPLYAPAQGKNPFGITGQALHAGVLGFNHPTSGKYLEFSADLPPYFSQTLDKLRKSYQ